MFFPAARLAARATLAALTENAARTISSVVNESNAIARITRLAPTMSRRADVRAGLAQPDSGSPDVPIAALDCSRLDSR